MSVRRGLSFALIFTALSVWGWMLLAVYGPVLTAFSLTLVNGFGIVFWIATVQAIARKLDNKDVYAEDGCLLGYRIVLARSNSREEWVSSPFIHSYTWHQEWNKAEPWGKHKLYSLKKNKSVAKGLVYMRDAGEVIVEVELAGNIDVCEKGYRAEYARVVAVIADKKDLKPVDEFVARYFDCPIRKP